MFRRMLGKAILVESLLSGHYLFSCPWLSLPTFAALSFPVTNLLFTLHDPESGKQQGQCVIGSRSMVTSFLIGLHN